MSQVLEVQAVPADLSTEVEALVGGRVTGAATPEQEAEQRVALAVALGKRIADVQSTEQYSEAASIHRRCVDAKKKILGFFTGSDSLPGPKAILWKAYKAMGARESGLVKPLEVLEEAAERGIKAWNARQEQLRLADEARLRREQEAREQDERELAAMMAEEDGLELQAASIRQAPSSLPSVVLPRSAYVPADAPVTLADNWTCEIVDAALLAQAAEGKTPQVQADLIGAARLAGLVLLAKAIGAGQVPPDAMIGIGLDKDSGLMCSPFLRAKAKDYKLALQYPGVRVFNDKSVRSRRGR